MLTIQVFDIIAAETRTCGSHNFKYCMECASNDVFKISIPFSKEQLKNGTEFHQKLS